MGHGKETPRQKMIGMMYLVLTALLALNVSAEVLNAFILVDNSLVNTSSNFKMKIDEMYTSFEEALIENEAKVKPHKEKADDLKIWTQELIDYMNELKLTMVEKADGKEVAEEFKKEFDSKLIKKKDENNIPSEVMFLNEKGKELKEKLDAYRQNLLGLIEDKERYAPLVNGIKNTLNTEDSKNVEGKTVSWDEKNFYHLPLAGAITMLSKLQTDIRNSEADMLNFLLGKITESKFNFNKVEAIVKPKSSYILKGQTYEAEVFIAAQDTQIVPTIIVGGRELPVNEGKGVYKATGNNVGFQTWGGEIQLRAATGELLKYPFKAEYQVGQAGAVVSPTKMNVFYIGVENPVDISVSGVPDNQVRASLSGGGGRITKKGGKNYSVFVKNRGKCYINVMAEFDGTTKQMGRQEFRIKRVPDPVAAVGRGSNASEGGVIKKNMLIALGGVYANMKNFDFDLRFKVTGFAVSVNIGGFNEVARSRGSRFTSDQINLIKKVKPGSKVYIEEIKAKGPDGTTRNLGTLTFRVN